MQVTQIFFDRIQADGRNWTAVIDHGKGGRTFHCLQGVTSGPKSLSGRRALLKVRAAGATGNVNSSDSLAMSVGHEAVMACPER
jgi:hypothetical protein